MSSRVVGNKRLANPPCQFNLASNPGEMLIRTSLPLCSTAGLFFSRSLLRSLPAPPRSPRLLVRECNATQRACSRAPLRNDTLFSRKDTAARPGPTTWKLCAKRAAPAVSLLGRSATFPSAPCSRYPFRPSTLVIYRGYAADVRRNPYPSADKKRRTRRKEEEAEDGEEKKKQKRCEARGSAILSSRLDHPASPPPSPPRDRQRRK